MRFYLQSLVSDVASLFTMSACGFLHFLTDQAHNRSPLDLFLMSRGVHTIFERLNARNVTLCSARVRRTRRAGHHMSCNGKSLIRLIRQCGVQADVFWDELFRLLLAAVATT